MEYSQKPDYKSLLFTIIFLVLGIYNMRNGGLWWYFGLLFSLASAASFIAFLKSFLKKDK